MCHLLRSSIYMKLNDHYLKKEIYSLIREDSRIFDFIQGSLLDGLWYWDLEKQENVWLSPRFWTLLGYDPSDKKHLISERQTVIFPEDLQVALNNFKKHCTNPDYPYDQVVRYRHKDGSTVWVRCRGMVICDETGKPIRMMGAHTDLTLHKQAENRLIISDKRSRAWLEHSPVCTKIVDLGFNLQYMSSTGVSDVKIDDITDYYGKPYPFSFYPDSFKIPMTNNLVKAKETGEVVTQEAFVNDIKGNKLWYHSTIIPVKNAKDQIDYIMVVSINITEQKRVEDTLQLALADMEVLTEKRTTELYKSEERFSLAMRGANDGLWDWNLETDEVYYSPRWKNMLGYKDNELDANIDTWKTLVHPDDKDWVLEKAKDYLNSRVNSFEVEMRMHHKDGHEVFVLSRAFKVCRESDAKPTRLVGTHVNITGRKKSEQFILETSNILKMIATREPASDIYIAIAFLYESRHPGLRCSMLVLVGNKLMHGGAPSLPKEYCDAVNGLENGPNVGSCGTSTYTGKRVLVENIETDPRWEKIKHLALPHGMQCCWSEPIKNSAGKVLGAFGMYYNHPALPTKKELNDLESAARLAGIIMEREKSEKELNQNRQNLEKLVAKRTLELEERKRAEEERKKLQDQLQHAQKMEAIGILAGGIAHDFNNILGAILGYSEMAQEQAPNGSILRADLDNVLLAGNRAKELVTQILAFSRKVKSEQKPLLPQPIIKEAIKLLRSSIPTTILITQDIDNGYGMIKADPTQLHQVIVNLCTNAYQAMEEYGGTLSIGLERIVLTEDDLQDEPSLLPGPYTQLTVTDTGPGIDPVVQRHVFDPYFTTKEVGEGTGMGLAVVHGIVKNHGGMIRIHSKLGVGTSFNLFFPELSEVAKENNETVLPIPTGNERILFIDDEAILANMGKQLLERLGYSVTATTNSLEALEMFKAQPEQFDLVVTDQTMPGMTGADLARAIFVIRQDMPIILCTGYSNAISKEKALDMGIREFAMKPMVKKDIAPLVRRVLDGKKTDSEK